MFGILHFSGEKGFADGRGNLLELLWWDGDSLCLLAKRLENGSFIWAQPVRLDDPHRAQLAMLLEGIDWRRPVRTGQPETAG